MQTVSSGLQSLFLGSGAGAQVNGHALASSLPHGHALVPQPCTTPLLHLPITLRVQAAADDTRARLGDAVRIMKAKDSHRLGAPSTGKGHTSTCFTSVI